MKIQEALALFTTQLEANGRSIHTIKQYQRHVGLFASWTATVGLCGDISEITNDIIARFLSSTQARTRPDGGVKKAVSMNSLRTSIKGFFKYLHQAGYILEDPSRLVKRAKCGTPPPRVLSETELDKLFEVIKNTTGKAARRDYVLFKLLLATGIRLGSALAMTVKDVDLDNAEIWLKTTKGDQPCRIFIGEKIQKFLENFIGIRTSGLLFTGNAGRQISQRHAQRRFTIWAKKANIKRLGVSTSKHRNSAHRNQVISYITEDDLVLIARHMAAGKSDTLEKRKPESTFKVDCGVFYLIQLEPEHDAGRFKVGFASNLPERLRDHRCSAPFATVLATWPCLL